MPARARLLVVTVALVALVAACTPWSQLGGGAARTGRTTSAPGLDLATVASVGLVDRWTAPTGPVAVPPVVTEDRVLVATDADPVGGTPSVLAFRRDGTGCSAGPPATCAPEWQAPLLGAPQGLAVVGDAVVVTSLDPGTGWPWPDQYGLQVLPLAPGAHCDAGAVPTCDPEWAAAGGWPSAPAVVGERIVAATLDGDGALRVAAFDRTPTTCTGSGVPVCEPAWLSVALAPGGLPPWGVAVAGDEVWIGAAGGTTAAPSAEPALLAFPLDGAGCAPSGPGALCSPVAAATLPGDPVGVPSIVAGQVLSLVEVAGEPGAGDPPAGTTFADVVAVDRLACTPPLCAVAWTAPGPAVAAPAHVASAGPGRLTVAGADGWVVYDVAACAAGDLDGCLDLYAAIEGVPTSPVVTTDDVTFVGHAGTTVDPLLPGDGGVHAFDPSGATDCGPTGIGDPLVYDWCTPVWSGLSGTPVTVAPVPAGDALHVVAGGELHVLGPPALP